MAATFLDPSFRATPYSPIRLSHSPSFAFTIGCPQELANLNPYAHLYEKF